MFSSLKKYKYDYKNEGKEPLQKLIGLGKYIFMGAMFTSAYDLSMIREPPSLRTVLVLGGKHIITWLGASATFTTAVLCLTNTRKKDDQLNYFFGALASGAFTYSFVQRGSFVLFMTTYVAIGAAILKFKVMKGYKILEYDIKYKSASLYINRDNTPDVRYEKP
ncbi:uncharacterized protein LOC118451440 [Vespa mandarinia]|uniref:uncharacterized protein LOC118451440 n=1 Tax=Vespa mandarinia TaxID=7446 RepID=UPI00160A335C|nr:uncharacterized protein LOC118451440 [Vespa mandarinia]XP_035743881.1 uncharacterized protein LOC118451440 [Vespa mandarinia]